MKYTTMGFAALFIMLLAVSDANAVVCAPGVARAECASTAQRPMVVAQRKPVVAAPRSRSFSVCYQGCDFNDLQQAVNAAQPGGVVTVAAEVNGTCAVIRKPLRLLGLQRKDGRRAHLAGGVCMGKGPLVTAAANIEIEGFEISGVAVGSKNGACIRMDPGSRDVSLRNINCHDSQNGILGQIKGRLLIEDSLFEGNGFDNGQSHGMYVSGDEMLIRRSRILATKDGGHPIKSGVQRLIVEDSIIAALNSRNSRALDAFAGGDVKLRRNVIQQGPKSDNSHVIGLGLETNRLLPDGHSFLMEDNLVIFDDSSRGRKMLFRANRLGPIVLRNNVLVGLNGLGVEGAKEEGNHWHESREQAGLPRYDGSLNTLPRPGTRR